VYEIFQNFPKAIAEAKRKANEKKKSLLGNLIKKTVSILLKCLATSHLHRYLYLFVRWKNFHKEKWFEPKIDN